MGLTPMFDQLAIVWKELISGPVFLIGISCLVYGGAKAVYERCKWSLLHPVLMTIVILIVLLRQLHIDYATYKQATSIIQFILEVSVVALALPLYHQLAMLRRNSLAIGAAVFFGGIAGIVSAVVPFKVISGSLQTAISAAPSSVTTPVAMAIAEVTGGIPSLTAVIVVITGLLGAVIGPFILRLIGVTDPVAFGLAMGTAAHGIGTARALQEGELQGATASLGLCLNALVTAAATPLLLSWLLGI